MQQLKRLCDWHYLLLSVFGKRWGSTLSLKTVLARLRRCLGVRQYIRQTLHHAPFDQFVKILRTRMSQPLVPQNSDLLR
jgi:hypothetical protein